MSRKDIIFETLKRQCELAKLEKKDLQIESSDLADALGYDRSNVSRDLNELVREGRVEKSNGRPVYFWPVGYADEENNQKEKDEFFFLVGEKGSLKKSVQQAKSAVLYPPRGLHTLLTGPTGTGKTTFAERMYEYAKYMKIIRPDAKFVVFNCAEYAENPQLLMSQMFGHKKGAFTGALSDRPGLVELADGGILFLDEIHRLPADGQEMLFLLMDKGIYRRLGETEAHRKSGLMIIGATTENIDTSLLKTFLRRMPVIIKMPPLSERSLTERLQLIGQFFSHEQRNMGEVLHVDKEALLALLTYECAGNVGQLRADIQLICARAFLAFKIGTESERVEVDRTSLPEYIWLDYSKHRTQTNDLILFLQSDETYSLDFPGHADVSGKTDVMGMPERPEEISICSELAEKYMEFKSQGKTEDEIKNIISCEIEGYTNQLLSEYRMEGQKATKDSVLKVVDPKVYDAVTDALNYASIKLKRDFTDTVIVGMAMHVEALIKRAVDKTSIQDGGINVLVLKYPKELKAAKVIRAMLEEELDIEIPASELGYLTMFLCSESLKEEKTRIGLIVISHGKSTAGSMAEVANSILGTKHCKSVDMPLDSSVNDVFDQVKVLVEREDQGMGVLLLVDMGSLVWFAEQIAKDTGRNVMSVEMVSTLMVIDTLRKILMGNHSLKEICEEAKNGCEGFIRRKQRGKAGEPVNLLGTCGAGRGTAVRIGEIIREAFKDYDIEFEFTYMNLMDKQDGDAKIRERIGIIPRAVVGTVDLGLKGIPYISVEDLVTGYGMANLEQLLFENVRHEKEGIQADHDAVMETALGRVLSFLAPEKMCRCTGHIYETIIENGNRKEDRKTRLRFMIHVSCMAERIIQNNIFMNRQTEQLKEQYGELFGIVKDALGELESLIGIEVPESECAYLVELLTE